jgi:hypothetical protein
MLRARHSEWGAGAAKPPLQKSSSGAGKAAALPAPEEDLFLEGRSPFKPPGDVTQKPQV